jgi:hypothetical protein
LAEGAASFSASVALKLSAAAASFLAWVLRGTFKTPPTFPSNEYTLESASVRWAGLLILFCVGLFPENGCRFFFSMMAAVIP